MQMISIQMLLINILVAGLVTGALFLFFKRLRGFNPLLIFTVSSLGSSTGAILAIILPPFNLLSNSILLNNILLSIPGVALAMIFTLVWIKGSRTEGYI